MNRRISVYGLVAGFIIILTSILSIESGVASAWLGFLVMFMVFSSIFIAVKQHRDEVLGGVIGFNIGFMVGLGISLIASLVYVLVWEIYLALNDYSFIETYTQAIVDAARAQGASSAELASKMEEMENMRTIYFNPFMRLPMTFVEIFPVGFLVSLVTALVLKK